MSEKPKSAEWRDFAHSIEVMAAAAAAKHTLDETPAAAPLEWLNFAHSIDVLSASASAQQELQSAWPANTVSLASVRAAATQRVNSGGGWRGMAERRPMMSAISAVAAMLIIAAFVTSPSAIFKRHGDPEIAKGPTQEQPASTQVASAELPASTQALMERLRCRAGQDCLPASSGSSVIRSLGSDPAQRRPIIMGTLAGRDDIEARAQAGELPVADVEIPFGVNSAELPLAAKAQLDALGETVKRSGGVDGPLRFALIGDAAPLEAERFTLSQRRAKAVANYLVTGFGIDARQLDAFGRSRATADPIQRSAASSQRVQVVNLGRGND